MPDSSELVATFLDAGQGDSTIATLPNGTGILVDCPIGSAQLVVDYLESSHIAYLELVVVTHSDSDHAGGVVQVIKSFQGPTRRIAILPDRTLTQDAQSNRRYGVMLRELAQMLRLGIARWEPYEGNLIEFGDVVVSVLHPSAADHFEALSLRNHNDSSIVLRIDYSGARILLAAACAAEGMAMDNGPQCRSQGRCLQISASRWLVRWQSFAKAGTRPCGTFRCSCFRWLH